MAEFKEVMKEAKRMCKRPMDCFNCPIAHNENICKVISLLEYVDEIDFDGLEKAILAWAKNHPRRKYPTWREWGKAICMIENAPPLLPCHFIECSRKDSFCPNPCPYLDNEIPAEFAQKANIRPLENKKEGFVLD